MAYLHLTSQSSACTYNPCPVAFHVLFVAQFLAMESNKLAVLGQQGAGKSSLVMQLIQNIFPEEIDPTIENSYCHYLNVDGQRTRLDIMDTCRCI